MIQFRPGSHVHRLVTLLSVVGEYPVRSVHLLGNDRVYKAMIHKLTMQQRFRNSQTGTGDSLICYLNQRLSLIIKALLNTTPISTVFIYFRIWTVTLPD